MRPRFASAPVRLATVSDDEDAFWDVLDRRGKIIARGITLAQVRARRQHGLMSNAALIARENTTEWQPIDELLRRERLSESEWYVTRPGGAVIGPVSTQRLDRGLREGMVPVDCVVCRAGSSKWVKIRNVPTFADAVAEASFDSETTTEHSGLRWSFESF